MSVLFGTETKKPASQMQTSFYSNFDFLGNTQDL